MVNTHRLLVSPLGSPGNIHRSIVPSSPNSQRLLGHGDNLPSHQREELLVVHETLKSILTLIRGMNVKLETDSPIEQDTVRSKEHI